LSKASGADWWTSLSPEQQKEYIAEHPRSKYAKDVKSAKTEKAGAAKTSHALTDTKLVDGKLVMASGEDLPPHIVALKLPPAWKPVTVNTNPGATLLAIGRDAKGRAQRVYSEAFKKTQAEAKFRRVEELNKKFDQIVAQNGKSQRSKIPKVKDSADCLALIMHTGIRPGSDTDTGAAVKAYGATTLQGKHVVQTSEGVELHFVGKKGVHLKIPVTDPDISKSLMRRKHAAGADGNLFPATSDKALLEHTHSMDGGGFKSKDMRTHLGTSTALDEVKKLPVPKTKEEYQKAVMNVAKTVSKKLGNTAVVALQSYINPTVFSEWQSAVEKS